MNTEQVVKTNKVITQTKTKEQTLVNQFQQGNNNTHRKISTTPGPATIKDSSPKDLSHHHNTPRTSTINFKIMLLPNEINSSAQRQSPHPGTRPPPLLIQCTQSNPVSQNAILWLDSSQHSMQTKEPSQENTRKQVIPKLHRPITQNTAPMSESIPPTDPISCRHALLNCQKSNKKVSMDFTLKPNHIVPPHNNTLGSHCLPSKSHRKSQGPIPQQNLILSIDTRSNTSNMILQLHQIWRCNMPPLILFFLLGFMP